MRYRILDENLDMTFGSGQANFYIDNVEGIEQSILTRLKLWVGEWYLDTNEGTPYQQSALGTNKSTTIQPAIRDRILQTDGVTGLQEKDFNYKFNPSTRQAEINATVSTQYGDTTITGIS